LINIKTFKLTEPSDLEKEIARLFALLSTIDVDDAKYNTVSDQLAKLYKLKEVDSKSSVSKDALVGAAVNLAGIFIITQHEHLHIITSKALAFVGKKSVV
jgi:hypothetical protein